MVLVLCYLHSTLKIAERCRRELRKQVLIGVWHAYKADTRRSFSQRLRRLQQWARKSLSEARDK
jgi:hypothetical protein